MTPPRDAMELRLRAWSNRFQRVPLAKEVVAGLDGRADEIWRGTFELLRKESPEYRNAVDHEFTAESKRHCGELLAMIVRIAAGNPLGSNCLEFVRRHAAWRARHEVPLVASLHAYRLAHKTYWGLTRQWLATHRRQREALRALTMLSDFWIELFETVGAALEDAHATEEARTLAQHTRAHARLIDDLLNGTGPSDIEARQLLAVCGFHPGLTMTVGVFRRFPAADGRHGDAHVALRSTVRLLNQVFPTSQFGRLIGLRDGEVVLIAGSRGLTSQLLARHLGRHGFTQKGSLGICVGLGLDKDDTAQIPDALTEARSALELTGPHRPMLRFADVDLAEFVTHGADRMALRLVPDWVRTAHEAGMDQELLLTIRAFARCSLNVKETARQLNVHANTIYFRLNQIKQRTKVDPRTFEGLTHLVTSLRLLDTHRRRGHDA